MVLLRVRSAASTSIKCHVTLVWAAQCILRTARVTQPVRSASPALTFHPCRPRPPPPPVAGPPGPPPPGRPLCDDGWQTARPPQHEDLVVVRCAAERRGGASVAAGRAQQTSECDGHEMLSDHCLDNNIVERWAYRGRLAIGAI